MTFSEFMRSYNGYGWYDYREGVGYGVEELNGIDENEVIEIEKLILEKSQHDWPDVEVMLKLKTNRCIQALNDWMKLEEISISCHSMMALKKLHLVNDDLVIEKIKVWLPKLTILNGMVMVHRLTLFYKKIDFNNELLDAVLNGHDDIIGHSAGLLLYRNNIIKSQDDYWNKNIINNINVFKGNKVAHFNYIRSLTQSAQQGD